VGDVIHSNGRPVIVCGWTEPRHPASTGLVIVIGQRIAYYPAMRKAYHENSKHADELRALEFSRAFNMADANY
jgi:hypothetical protein